MIPVTMLHAVVSSLVSIDPGQSFARSVSRQACDTTWIPIPDEHGERSESKGLAPLFFQFAPTFYFNNRGVAGRIEGSYDILLTNRLIAQPQFELNFYSRSDPSRAVGLGLSEIDTGLRIRYEISCKFAPYVGFAYTGQYGAAAGFARREGGIANDPRFVFGIRVWYQAA